MISINYRPLEQSGSLEILTYLLEKSEAKLTEILAHVRSLGIGQSAMYKALKLLKRRRTHRRNYNWLSQITFDTIDAERPQSAEKLLEIKEILEEDKK